MPNPQPTHRRSGREVPDPQLTRIRVGFYGSVSPRVSGGFEWGRNPPERTKNVENRRDLSRSVQDPERSSRIWQRSRQIRWLFPQIVLRIVGSGVLVAEICQIVLENLKSQLVVLSSGGSGWTGFEGREPKPNRRRRVLKFGTRVRPPELSDRVVAGRVRAGWAGWTSQRVRWTALVTSYNLTTTQNHIQ